MYSVTVPTLEKRVDKDHTYFRCEIGYLPANHSTAEKLRNIADQLDAIVNYCEPVVEYSSRPRREIKSLLDVLI